MNVRRGHARYFFPAVAFALTTLPAAAQTVVEMQTGIPDAKFVPRYSPGERAKAARSVLNLPSLPALGAPVSLTPNAPYARGGAHLSFWKPSFVIGTVSGGEAGVNFWGIHVQGHMNVGLAPKSMTVLDCRMLSAGNITYKIYVGAGATAASQGEVPLRDGHFLLSVPAARAGEPVSVELWPTPDTETVGFFGCDLSAIR